MGYRVVLTSDLQGHSRSTVKDMVRDNEILPAEILMYLTSRLTTSGAWTGDLVVLLCTHSIPKRSHEKAVPYTKQEYFL